MGKRRLGRAVYRFPGAAQRQQRVHARLCAWCDKGGALQTGIIACKAETPKTPDQRCGIYATPRPGNAIIT